jgi:transposase, IS5 family
MLRTRNDQPTLWDAIIPPELLELPELLARVDRLLDDERFFTPFVAHFHASEGRPSIPMETYLRLMFSVPLWPGLRDVGGRGCGLNAVSGAGWG